MQTIKIFVASSFELRRWREAIGDLIRRKSDEYEPRGFRIKLSCWEDYHPEFTGTRKQTEYNEDLVKPCDLFFALFWEKCGKYTQEEIKIGNVLKSNILYVIKKRSHKQTLNLDTYLNQLQNTIFEVDHIKEALNLIQTKLEEYIKLKYDPFISKSENRKIYNVFATIPNDKIIYRLIFSNLIRSLDNFAEENFKIRCKLKWDTSSDLLRSNYYIGLLGNQLSDKDKFEITYAIEHSKPNSNPETAILYYKHSDAVIKNNPEIGYLMEKYGCFKEEFDNLCTVKYHLLVWLYSKRDLEIDNFSGVSISDDGWVEFMGMSVIPLSSLNIHGTSKREMVECLLAKISSEIFNPSNKSIDIDPEQPININLLRDHIDKVNTASILAQRINNYAIISKQHILNTINERLQYLSNTPTKEYVEEAIDLITSKIELLKDLLDTNTESIENLLRAYIQFASICDNNRNIAVSKGIIVDNIFKQIVDMADNYNFYDTKIEIMRMNYANYLSRTNRNKEAIDCYSKTMHNIAIIDDATPIVINRLTAIFLNFAHSLAHLGANEMLTKLINDYEIRVAQWSEAGTLPYPKIVYRIFVLAILLTERNTGEFIKYIEEATTIYNIINTLNINPVDKIWDDIFCNFPITLIASILDYMPNQEGLDIITPIAKNTLHNINSNPNLDLDTRYCYLSDIYHNLAFGYSNANNQIAAREFGLKALEIVKKWYKKSNYSYILREIASNLHMIGATYINDHSANLSSDKATEALNYAQEALSIFQNLNNNDFIEEKTDVYKAKLLIGSILIDSGKDDSKGKKLVKQCFEWSEQNPTNSYRDIFESEATRYLS